MNYKTAQTMMLFIGFALIFPMRAVAAELTLEAEKTSVAVGETLNINVNLSGNEPTVGTDLVLKYDPKIVQVIGVESNQLYPVYNPAASSRMNASTGTIKLSGSANFGKPVNANGTFAMLKVKMLMSGTATLQISYKKGSTTLSGVLGTNGQELLSFAPKALTIKVTGDMKKQSTSVQSSNSNPVLGFFQTVVASVSTFFKSMFSWVK